MRVSAGGLLRAGWLTLRALILVAAAFIVARWSTIAASPSRGDATPQLSFMTFVALPLLGLVFLGLMRDTWVLWRPRSPEHRSARLALAVTGTLLLAAAVVRFLD